MKIEKEKNMPFIMFLCVYPVSVPSHRIGKIYDKVTKTNYIQCGSPSILFLVLYTVIKIYQYIIEIRTYKKYQKLIIQVQGEKFSSRNQNKSESK